MHAFVICSFASRRRPREALVVAREMFRVDEHSDCETEPAALDSPHGYSRSVLTPTAASAKAANMGAANGPGGRP